MRDLQTAILIGVVALVTLLLRFLPFLVFNGKREAPRYILFLGDKLPYAIMGMLIIYCLRNVTFTAVGVLIVAALHIWRRNTLLSILGGTVVYMVLVQAVFV